MKPQTAANHVHDFLNGLKSRKARVFGYSLESVGSCTLLKLHGMNFPEETRSLQRRFEKRHYRNRLGPSQTALSGWRKRRMLEPQMPPNKTLWIVTILTRIERQKLVELMREHRIPAFARIGRAIEESES